jgi:hypothetical protein
MYPPGRGTLIADQTRIRLPCGGVEFVHAAELDAALGHSMMERAALLSWP